MSSYCRLLLVGACLLMLIVFNHPSKAQQTTDQRCLYAIGDYRNCTCGVQYRIIEQRCCSTEICLKPVLSTENFTCPFECLNGGTFDSAENVCRCSKGYYGACCERETELCGDILLQHKGEFTSPGFPNRYKSLSNCVWRISTDPNRRIALGIKNKDFNVEPGANIYSCNYDSVSVFDSVNGKDGTKLLGQFCGNVDFPRTFRTVYSTGSNLYVKFTSDYIIQRTGFRLQYSVFFAGQECGPLMTYSRSKGTITSPQYPIQYRPHERCQWDINVLQGREVILTMNDIDMPTRSDCRYEDFLLVSGVQAGNETPIDFGVYCGTKAFRSYRIYGEYEQIQLKFSSNGEFQGKGFSLEYEQVEVSSVSGTSSDEMSNEEQHQANLAGPQLLVTVKT